MNLKEVLEKNRVSYRQFGSAIVQPNGNTLSATAVSKLLNQGLFPKRMTLDSLKKQIEHFFTSRGIQTVLDWTALQLSPEETPKNFGAAMLAERPTLRQETVNHFKLPRNPFLNDVRAAADLYLSHYQRYVKTSMIETARNGGFIAVIGEPGSGKTSLVCDLPKMCADEGESVVMLRPKYADKQRVKAQNIYDSIILQLSPNSGLPSKAERSADKAERLIRTGQKNGTKYVLVIDDAQDMHIQTLLSIKGFWDKSDGFESLVGVILIGQPELADILSARNPSAYRLALRVEKIMMSPYTEDEMRDYLTLKFKKAGIKIADVFADTGFAALHKSLAISDSSGTVTSRAYPLVINNQVLHCMNWVATTGTSIGCSRIDADAVREVRNG